MVHDNNMIDIGEFPKSYEVAMMTIGTVVFLSMLFFSEYCKFKNKISLKVCMLLLYLKVSLNILAIQKSQIILSFTVSSNGIHHVVLMIFKLDNIRFGLQIIQKDEVEMFVTTIMSTNSSICATINSSSCYFCVRAELLDGSVISFSACLNITDQLIESRGTIYMH